MPNPITRLGLGPRERTPRERPPARSPAKPEAELEAAVAWMCPPDTTSDPVAWDGYWGDERTWELAAFNDAFSHDEALVAALRAHGLATVLCVGNGGSQEPRALAWAGFQVTALDLSPLATEVARHLEPPPEHLARLVGARAARPGGSATFVAGDLMDPAVCPGPYDVVLERRTLQLFAEAERAAAVRAVADRLAARGVFVSHTHDGRWRPEREPWHATAPWFEAEGWPPWRGEHPLSGRAVWLVTTTG